MLKEMIMQCLYPVLYCWMRLRYKNIWALKRRLMQRPCKLMGLFYGQYFLRRGSFVGLRCELVGTPCFPHGIQGIFISNSARIGKDAVLFQQVTIGSNGLPDSRTAGAPALGDCVYVGAGAKIIGGVTVGDNCRIGANAVVYSNMPPHSVAVCAPTRILQKEKLENTFRHNFDGVEYFFRDGRLQREE